MQTTFSPKNHNRFKVIILAAFFQIYAATTTAQNDVKFSGEILTYEKNATTVHALNDIAFHLLEIGEYKKVLQLQDIANCLYGHYLNGRYKIPYSPQEIQSAVNNHFPAVEYVTKRTKENKIVIINEAHTQPLHRVFTAAILKNLYNNGFRYFAVEALWKDSLLRIDKYPTWVNSGYYTSEPQFGNLLREAIQIGYKVIAYDTMTGVIETREYLEAKNIIKKTFEVDTAAKVLIHCGYGHGDTYPYGDGWLMGGWLKKLTGINPLNIDQVRLTERSMPQYEAALYNEIQNDSCLAFAFNEKDAKVFSMESQKDYIYIYHPRTKYIAGRPNWLNFTGEKKYFFPMKEKNLKHTFPVLVKAYKSGEDISRAIPVDCIEILSENDERGLVLLPGTYTIIYKYSNGTSQEIQIDNKK